MWIERQKGIKMKGKVSQIDKIIFTNKQNIPWNDVEQYLKRWDDIINIRQL